MLLAIDIGNTRTCIGLFDNNNLINTWSIESDLHKTSDEYGIFITNLLKNSHIDIKTISKLAICSVVPKLTTAIQEMSIKYFSTHSFTITANVKTGIDIKLDNPKEIGADRIANAVAVNTLYHDNYIAVDMGTATTFDVISSRGEYFGGSIAPGIDMAAETMANKTSLLPRIDLVDTPNAIGKSTITAMQSGLLYGYVGLIEGIICKIRTELKEDYKIIATGGAAEILSKHTVIFDEVDPYLTLKGIYIISTIN